MKLIDRELLENISIKAAKSERKRINFNFHQLEDGVQRMLNAIEPDSYVRPHRHINPDREEFFVVLKGKGGVILFDENGKIQEKILLDPISGNIGIDISGRIFHTIFSLEKGSVFFEVKPGPYDPLADKGFADWAPEENSIESVNYLLNLKKNFL